MTKEDKEYIINTINDFVFLWQSFSQEEQLLIADIFDQEGIAKALILFESVGFTRTLNWGEINENKIT